MPGVRLQPFPTLRPTALPPAEVEGLYVHIPFCFHKCHYCDFYSITRQGEGRMERFVELVLAEAEQWGGDCGLRIADCGLEYPQSEIPNPQSAIRNPQSPTLRPRTVFFGGGTPTLLPARLMRDLIAGLRRQFDFSALTEWTVEANPATVDREYCAMLREMGVDRLSFGAQSFDRAELATLERHHEPQQVADSLAAARAAGFERLNVDLIYAIPGQDLASWSRSLEAAIALGTTHVSCYGLTYEPNTPMAVRKRLGQFRGVDESVELEMFHHTRRRLAAAGLPAYEISNYAAPGQECRHNLMYWAGGNYVGLGPSAASHVAGWRWKNRPHLGEWEDAVGAGALPAADVERLTPGQRAGELAMLELRLARGLDLADFSSRTGLDALAVFADPIDRFGRVGLVEVTAAAVRLTEKGLDVADAVAAEFLSAASDKIDVGEADEGQAGGPADGPITRPT